jgi:guanosine-3',5'-bis(diphosphate) 3'-pyrophosphohydrolase|tara:strand:- start:2294 stop:4435 length:2142 start_codon:yes stop_codon:yes gene_type:complete
VKILLSVDDLIGAIKKYNPQTNSSLIEKAYQFGLKAHAGQMRKSGEPFFAHPVQVAKILSELRLDDASIITALLHDTIEDTSKSFRDVSNLFGPEIANLVDGVTKLSNLEVASLERKQAENFRKLIVAISKDLRVLLVKLADRLHNMRTIRAVSNDRQLVKANETMDIYAPLAGRMGIQSIRDELEDLSFRILNPEARNSIIRRFLKLKKASDDLIPKIINDIESQLDSIGVKAVVSGREKKPYSIWRKIQDKQQAFYKLSDIFGFRIITKNEKDVYTALGAVHSRWSAVPGRFKDYISQPKSNGYRSIHTTVSGRDGKRVEVQIRTKEMHDVAETGVAAHWSYRNGERFENPFAVDPSGWFRRISEEFIWVENSDDFIEQMKLEMFQDKVFCFTPKGEVVKLPRGATPLDFAYAIHTSIGDNCVGSEVDGIKVPLWSRLRNGQSVKIVTASGQKPGASWEEMVVTGRAKAAIRKSIREERRSENIKLGKEIARVSLERIGKKLTDNAIKIAAEKLGLKDEDSVLAALGSVQFTGFDLVNSLYPELINTKSAPLSSEQDSINFIGLSPDSNGSPAPCCLPIPGDPIVGIAQKKKGVVVHAIDCALLASFEAKPNLWLEVRWPLGTNKPVHSTSIEVIMVNSVGVLGRICTLIGEQGANISDLTFVMRKPDFYKTVFEITVRDLKHLHNIITSIQVDMDVSEASRYRSNNIKVK